MEHKGMSEWKANSHLQGLDFLLRRGNVVGQNLWDTTESVSSHVEERRVNLAAGP